MKNNSAIFVALIVIIVASSTRGIESPTTTQEAANLARWAGAFADARAALAKKNSADALAAYRKLLTEYALPPQVRGAALLDEAHVLEQNAALTEARARYEKLSADESLPPHQRDEARARLAALADAKSVPYNGVTALPPLPPPGLVLHVAPSGVDAQDGSAAKPFATLEKARDQIRALKKANALPAGGVAIALHGGTYPLSHTFILEKDDSGTAAAPIVYRAADGESPVLSGGVRLRGFKPVSDPAILARLPEESRGRVLVCDLRALGIAALPPLEYAGFNSGRGFHTHPTVELFFNRAAMQLARYPNDGELNVVAVRGSTPVEEHGLKGFKDGVITYDGDRPARWKDDKDALLYGYWFWDWADSYEYVASIDTARREISFKPPYPSYGFRKGQHFHAINLLSEIDVPGEWYLDRAASLLYFYPPSDPERAVVELSAAPFTFAELRNVAHVAFENIAWELGSADGVIVRGGADCRFVGCKLQRFAGNGLEILGGLRHTVRSCDVQSMGRGGVTVTGGDRKSLAPCGHAVENCDISNLSRIDHTYTPALKASGVGICIAHNLLHDIKSSAINLGGNDNLVEFNEVFNCVTESDDQGAVDMWGNPTFRGNVFRWNYWHHIGNWRDPDAAPPLGQAGIRLDDAISGTLIYGNLFQNCGCGKHGFGAIQIHGGKDNLVDANLFVDCRQAMTFSPWSDKRWRDFTAKSMDSKEIDRALYEARYPELKSLFDNHDINWVTRNSAVRCGDFFRHGNERTRSVDNTSVPPVVSAQNSKAPAPNPGVSRALAEEEQKALEPSVPLAQIGLYIDAWRRTMPVQLVKEARAEK